MSVGMGVLIVAESGPAGLRSAALELVTAGRALANELGQPLIGLILGSGVTDPTGLPGVDRLLVADDVAAESLTAERATSIVANAIRRAGPSLVLVANTTLGAEFAPRLAARVGAGIVADVVGLESVDGQVVATRPMLGGRLLVPVTLSGTSLQIALVRQGSFEKSSETEDSPAQETLLTEIEQRDGFVEVVGTAAKEAGGEVGLDSATIVVAGGRGLKEASCFSIVEELAAALGGAVGATRAVTDAGWRPHNEQIGQTGRVVAPRLYIAIGISGAVQHLVGMQGAETVVAINRDPDAPIFKLASFGIVGDLFQVVPALTAEIRAQNA